jgi:hypothetical protein
MGEKGWGEGRLEKRRGDFVVGVKGGGVFTFWEKE